jgi:site-specific DNA recombinase
MINNEHSKYTAACYCRLSRDDEQDGASVSIETQKKVLEDYCKANDFNVFDFYCDDGFTGTNFERPNFKRMMSDLNNGTVNMVVVKDLSRLGRNYIETGRLIEETFPEIGARFIAVGDDVDTDRENLDLDLMLPMKNIFNQYYPADCSRKTRQAFKTKALRGEFIGSTAPYGYKKSVDDKHVLEIDKSTAPTIKWIFEMVAYHGYGYNKIARVLSKKKILTPTAYQAELNGKNYNKDPYDWNLASVRKMLENQVYLGHTINGKKRKISFKSKRVISQPESKWIMVENTHEPIISKQLWNDAHKRLDSRKRTSKTGNVNIFAGLLKCDTCGCALGVANTSSRKNYYSCNTYKRKGKEACSIHYILKDDLYDIVLADIQKKLKVVKLNEEDFIKRVQKKLGSTDNHQKECVLKEISSLEIKIKSLDNKFDKLYEDRLEGVISDKRFKEMSGKCEDEQQKLSIRLDELKEHLNQQTEIKVNVSSFVETIKQYTDVKGLDKELLNRLIDKIVIGDKVKTDNGYTQRITIYYKFLGSLNDSCITK